MLIKFEEKHGDVFVQSPDRFRIFDYVLQNRIDDDGFYNNVERNIAIEHLADGKSEIFLAKRRDYEYEGYEQVTVVNV